MVPPHTSSPRQPGKKRRLRFIALAILVFGLGGFAGLRLLLIEPTAYIPLTGLDPTHLSLIALGDQGSGSPQQWTVAHAMERIANKDGRLDMVLLLGDNFYGAQLADTQDWNWQLKFEKVYWGRWLNRVPFYAVLGNHDYPTSDTVEIAYSEQHKGSGRWQMPAHTYSKDFGNVDGRPLLRVVFLDTSGPRTTLKQQIEFLDQAFQQPGPAPVWRAVAAHHPVRDSGSFGEDTQLITDLLPALQRNNVDLYLSGHDHAQKLMLIEGEPAWLISGGGGQKLDPLEPNRPGTQFAVSRAGFAKLDFSATGLQLAYYDEFGGAETRFSWARDCPWLAKGCLLPASTVAP